MASFLWKLITHTVIFIVLQWRVGMDLLKISRIFNINSDGNIMRKKIHFLYTLLICLIIYSAYSQERSIVPLGEEAGKWLLTYTVGGPVDAEPAHALKKVLKKIFSTNRGGGYQHIVDLSDKFKASSMTLTKNNFFESINQFNKIVLDYKHSNPEKRTMATIGLTGHGQIDSQGNYVFSLEDGKISGRELAKKILSIATDEIIIIMQSCYSGEIVNNDFPVLIEEFNDESKQVEIQTKKKIVVVAPTSKYLSSPLWAWEEVLENSFESTSVDHNSDGVITYEEWKNEIIRIASRHFNFYPEIQVMNPNMPYVQKSGIDPKFFEFGIDANFPLALSNAGLERYSEGILELPVMRGSAARISEKTKSIYENNSELFERIYVSHKSYLYRKLLNGTRSEKNKILFALRGLDFEIISSRIEIFSRIARQSDHMTTQTLAIFLLGKLYENEDAAEILLAIFKDGNQSESVRKEAFSALVRTRSSLGTGEYTKILQNTSQDAYYRILAAEGLASLNMVDSVPLFVYLIKNDEMSLVRFWGLRLLGKLKQKEQIDLVGNVLLKDVSEKVRLEAVSTLYSIGGNKIKKYFLKALTTEMDRTVKINIISRVGMLRIFEARDILEKMSLTEDDEGILRSIAFALAQISGH